MRRRGPLADSYPAAVALVVCALVPFLLLTAAVFPLAPLLAKSLHLSTAALDITIGLSDAGYAFGTVLAVQFAVHLPARRMLLGYVTVFLVAAVLAAWAPNRAVFIGAFIAEGLCTSLMLIAAVPPLVTGWPVRKMRWTAMIMNLCIFGAVALGPAIGELQASSGTWRPLFWGVAAVAAVAVLFSLLTFEDRPPQDRSAPWDAVAVALAVCGCAAAFFGAAQLQGGRPGGVATLLPLLAGIAMIVILVVHQYRVRHPLMPVKKLATTFPATGILTAMCASAAAVGLMDLILNVRSKGSPDHIAVLFLPEFGGAVVTAVLLGALLRTRFIPVLAMGGLVVLTAAAALLTSVTARSGALVAVSSALVGLGVGASVSPALFIAGFSLRSAEIQRVFALIELLRGVTAFLVAPVLLFLATAIGGGAVAGTHAAVWICLAIAAFGTVATVALYTTGGGRLPIPDLERWSGDGEPAWHSPPLLSTLRRSRQAGEPRETERVVFGGPITGLGGPDVTSKFTELAIDCAEPSGLARFWCSVLDYEVQDEDDGVVTIGSPMVPEGKSRAGPVPPVLTFAHVPEGKTVKNRVHLDINPTDREQDEEIERLAGLGATVVTDNRPEFSWVTLADPEGNEFCVLAGRRP